MKNNNLSIEERLENIEKLLLNQKTVLNLEELSIYIGLSKSTIYKLSSTQNIPFYRPRGKYIYFNKSEIDRWLLRNRVKTVDEIVDIVLSKIKVYNII